MAARRRDKAGGGDVPGLRAADVILAAALLAAALSVWFLLPRAGGGSVVVTVDGARYGVYPLNQPRTVVIETAWGHNTLVIEQGAVHMASADCPDGHCVRQGTVTAGGILCLPNRVAAEIVSDGGPDAVSS